MIGGIVIEVVTLADKMYVDCRDTHYTDTCAVHLAKNADSEAIEVGDRLWWQCGWAYWTPADESRADVKIPKVGHSGVQHPAFKKEQTE